MDLISDASLCQVLGFNLDAELSSVRKTLKTSIRYTQYDIQTALDGMLGEVLEPLSNITDKIEDAADSIKTIAIKSQ